MYRFKKTSTFRVRMRTRKCIMMLELDTSSPQHSPWRNSTTFLHVRMQKKCGKPRRKFNKALKKQICV